MNIVDILIILLLIVYTFKGLKNGAIKELVTFVGGFAVIVIAYLLKNPLSVLLYKNLPFFKFGGALAGISVLNIIVYELISFLIIAGVLMIIYKLILSMTNILDLILKITIILEIPSKILGAIIGLIEGVLVTFIILFVCSQISTTRSFIEESKFSNTIITKTPILAHAAEPIYKSAQEIYSVAENYRDSDNKNEANLQALDVLLKYKMIDIENAEELVKTGKLSIDNIDSVLIKYRDANN